MKRAGADEPLGPAVKKKEKGKEIQSEQKRQNLGFMLNSWGDRRRFNAKQVSPKREVICTDSSGRAG